MSRQRPPAPWVAALASARDTPSHVAMLDAFATGDAAALTSVTAAHYARLQEIVAAIPAEG